MKMNELINNVCVYLDELPIEDFQYEAMYKNLRYLRSKFQLTQLGSGSSREVYKLTDTLVIKIAYNEKGLVQNKFELNTWKKHTDLRLAQIFYYSPDYRYLIVERCTNLFTYLRETKLDGCDFCEAIENGYSLERLQFLYGLDINTVFAKKLHQNIQALSNTIRQCHLEDIYDEQIGINSDGEAVMLDYGADYKIMNQYYWFR